MRKLLIISLALIALTVLGWLAVYKIKGPYIQQDIRDRASAELRDNGINWASVAVDGRDVELSGVAPNEDAHQQALGLADVEGARTVSSAVVVGNGSSGAQQQGGSQQGTASGTAAQTAAYTEGNAGTGDADASTASAGDSASAETDASGADSSAGADTSADASGNGNASDATAQSTEDTVDEIKTPEPVGQAVPYSMLLRRNIEGRYLVKGVIPDMNFKDSIDLHLSSAGIDGSQVDWQPTVSSKEAPKNWEGNVTDSLDALIQLNEGEVILDQGKALFAGSAVTQDGSDLAEASAQRLSEDYETDINFSAGPKAVEESVTPVVGSSTYAAKVCQGELKKVLSGKKIQFDTGKTTLKGSSKTLLKDVAAALARCPDNLLNIHGYTDSQGNAKLNLALSRNRSERVQDYLIRLGVNRERTKAVGYGEARPIASNKTKAGRAKNRRIELIIKGT